MRSLWFGDLALAWHSSLVTIRINGSRGLLACLALAGCADEGTASEPELTEPPLARTHTRSRGRSNFVGVYRADTATWQLRLQRPGWKEAEGERTFVYGTPGDTPLVGDWNGDGAQTQGAWRDGVWSLSDRLGEGPTLMFRYGAARDLPVVGDWDGDGTVTVGVYRDGTFSLRNSNSEGPLEQMVQLGGPGDLPVAGDWDGDGVDTVGVYSRDGTFRLRASDETITTVATRIADGQPVVGDWDDDGRSTVGVRVGSRWTLLNYHRPLIKRDRKPWDFGTQAELFTVGEIAVDFGDPLALPVVGNWIADATLGFVPAPAELAAFLPLAADYQTHESFEKWQQRGMNTVLRVRSVNDPEAALEEEVDLWIAKAKALGLATMRAPRIDIAKERPEDAPLAWSLLDEPDIQPTDLYADVARLAAEVRDGRLPRRPVFTNFAGAPLLLQNNPPNPDRFGPGDRNPDDFYSRYLELQDWAAQDVYPLGQLYAWSLLEEEDAMAMLPLTMDKLRRWAPSKPHFPYIEAAQTAFGDHPQLTREQLRAQLWLALAHGARGIFYFLSGDCRKFGDGRCPTPDVMTPDLISEMTVQNKRITELTRTLQGEINPPGFGVTAAFPLETGWRDGLEKLIIAVNFSRERVRRWLRIDGSTRTSAVEVLYEGRSLEVVNGYTFADDFEPYAVHLYRFR
jgi:hypothetical protein